MKQNLLQTINSPEDIHKLSVTELEQLAADIRNEIVKIRKKGVAFDNEEHIKGVRCLAAPIKDYSSNTRAALCVVGPKDNFSKRNISKIQRDLLTVASDLSARLGYKPNG